MKLSQTIIQQDPDFKHRFKVEDFELERWKFKPETELLAGGRGASCKIQLSNQSLVLREYRRGGMMAALLHNRYLWSGLANSRPELEARVVSHALKSGLPVAPVVAYCLRRSGLYYRAALISEYIDNVGTVADVLGNEELSASQWQLLGELISKMHSSGIDHVDLNANNILINDDGQFYLIDFDKARIHDADGSWKKNNLDRLLRSLHKIRSQRAQQGMPFHFDTSHWEALMSGYR